MLFLISSLKRLGMERTSWALRRLYVPVAKEDLVLDIGSGGNPYPRANVLLDAFEEGSERYGLPLIKDRPIVYGLIERLPFRDKSFDFIIASHICEHTMDIDSFISEIQRVGKAGYIETPDAFFERINPYTFHRLEITETDGRLVVYNKSSWRHDSYIVDAYERKAKKAIVKTATKHPEPFYMRFYWSDKIDYEVLNPGVNISWPIPDFPKPRRRETLRSRFKKFVLRIIRRIFSQNRRNSKINLHELLMCPGCSSEGLVEEAEFLCCEGCGARYQLRDGIPDMRIHINSQKQVSGNA